MNEPNSHTARLLHELQRVIFVYHTYLLTPAEIAAWNSLMQKEKVDYCRDKPPEVAKRHLEIAEEFRAQACKDPVVEALLERGSDEFYFSVCLRVLRDHANDITLNLCPRCLALCRTPRAKQCPKCFHSWHAETS